MFIIIRLITILVWIKNLQIFVSVSMKDTLILTTSQLFKLVKLT
jgi:hypothetical protein